MKNELENTIYKIINGKSRIFDNTESFFVYLKWLWIDKNEVRIEKNRIYLWEKTKIWIIKPTNWTVRFLPLFYEKLEEITQWIANDLINNFDEIIVMPQELLEWLGYKWMEIAVEWKTAKKRKILCIGNPSPLITNKLLEIIKSKSMELCLPIEDIYDKEMKFPVKINTHQNIKEKESIKPKKKDVTQRLYVKNLSTTKKRFFKKWKRT